MFKLCFCQVVIALFLVVTSVSAADRPFLLIGGVDNYRPYSYLENGVPEGLYNEIIKELFLRINYPIKIELLPFKRLLSGTKNGEYDAMVGVFLNKERLDYSSYVYGSPLTLIYQSAFTTRDSGIKSSAISNMKGKIVGKKRGFIISENYQKAMEDGLIQINEAEKTEQLVRMIVTDRIDLFVQERENALFYIRKLNADNNILELSPYISKGRKTYIAFSKKNIKRLPEDFISLLDDAYLKMKSDGTLKEIFKKYEVECKL